MLEQKDLTVCGERFVIQQLPASNGFEVFIALSKILAGAKDGIIVRSLLNLEANDIDLSALIAGIIEKTDVKGTPAFLKKLVEDSVIKPELTDDLYDSTFAGNYSELFTLISEIIQFNHFDDIVKKNLSPFIESLFYAPSTGTKSTP